MAVLQETQKLFAQMKDSFAKNDFSTAKSAYDKIKVKLIQLPALPPNFGSSPTAEQELLLGREVLEQAVFLCLKAKEDVALERSFTQLKQFYADTRSLLPPSSQEYAMTGLNLMRLLVENRIAEFHTELELIPDEGLASPYVRYAIQLEQWLMEGAYNKVLAAKQQLPGEYLQYYMEQLASTVREEIASCSERAYGYLTFTDAQKVMMFKDQKELLAYAQERGWQVADGRVVFQSTAPVSGPGLGEEPRLALINQALVYAKELERIV